MKLFRTAIVSALVLGVVFVGCERKTTEVIQSTKTVSPSSAAYIGSEQCGTSNCHEAKYASFRKTGHPYKLNEAEDVQTAGYYPFTTVPNPPSGVAWSDVDKVIGGFWWKARFIDTTGFIITGPDVQYNLVDSSWSAYHDGETKPYKCGPCHMTAYKTPGNQEGKAGLVGTWAFNGVQCEECHGPGELHAADPYEIAMVVDHETELCGKCHIRGDVSKIPASKGFIRHHEQWNEMFTTKHSALKCVDCHDVHVGLHPLNPDRGAAIKVACEGCHFEETESFKTSSINHAGSSVGPSCIDCHMAKAAKSAVAAGPYEGDVHSHLWRINTSATAEMFTPDSAYANGFLTLEYTCLTCHNDKNKSWAASNASQVHANKIDDVSTCLTCHNDTDFGLTVVAIQNEYDNSVHASGDNTNRNRNNSSYYSACEKCHTSEGFIAEVTGIPATGEHFSAIGCFTCHKPHTEGTFGLRVGAAVNLANSQLFDRGNGNLCASCHQSRQDVTVYVADSVTLSTYWGPHHSNQADMLIGANAYEYTGYTYTMSPHSNVASGGCVDCHMSPPQHESVGGHSWNMENVDRGFENTSGCNVSTCHNGSITALNRLADADFDWDGTVEGVQTEINDLLDSLKLELLAAGVVDTSVVGAVSPIDNLVVPAADTAGALYNFLFVREDKSEGVHNTDYAVGLLQSSINYLATGNPNGVAHNRTQLMSDH